MYSMSVRIECVWRSGVIRILPNLPILRAQSWTSCRSILREYYRGFHQLSQYLVDLPQVLPHSARAVLSEPRPLIVRFQSVSTKEHPRLVYDFVDSRAVKDHEYHNWTWPLDLW